MPQKKNPFKEVPLPPKLMEPREDARKKLTERIDKGKALYNIVIPNRDEFEEIERKQKIWNDYNSELLSRLFNNSTIEEEYNESSFGFAFLGGTYTFQDEVNDYKKDVAKKITRLESILERLEIIPETQVLPIPLVPA